MDPAEVKQAEASTETPALPVVHTWKTISIASGASLVALVLVFWFLFGNRVTTDDAQVDGYITTVSPRVSGDVVDLWVKDNQQVEAGDQLVDIDPRDYQAAYNQAKAAYDVAVAEAQSAKVNISLTRDTTASTMESAADESLVSQADLIRSRTVYQQSETALLDAAKANLDAKLATNERAQADLKRYRPLLMSDDVSHFQFDAVEAAARVAKSEVLAAEQQVLGAQDAVDIAKAQVTAAEHQFSRSEAELRQSKAQLRLVPIREAQYQSALAAIERAHATEEGAALQLSYTHLAAPVSGRVTQRTVEVGQYVSPGQLLMTLVPLDRVYITANFKETQLAPVRPGQRVTIYADTYGSQKFEGTVDSIAGATGSRQALLPPQNATGNFVKVVQRIPVKILIQRTPQTDSVLRPGMNVEVTIHVH
jgi:membrane fusion protein (multidrug efflux system)